MSKKTTKICPDCGSNQLALFTSMNLKLCTNCYQELPWYLEEGQDSLHGTSHDKSTLQHKKAE